MGSAASLLSGAPLYAVLKKEIKIDKERERWIGKGRKRGGKSTMFTVYIILEAA
jgi:hypothetical protein